MIEKNKICVVGLGYVGLPLAVSLSKHFEVIGYDINNQRVQQLSDGFDATRELNAEELSKANGLVYTSNEEDIKASNFYIITVPTPIDSDNIPDLSPVISATKLVGKHLSMGDFVVYESTVYPGATEEVCVPILENLSSLDFNKSFFVGYSPERINPGDKVNRLENIVKITSGSNEYASEVVDNVYSKIIDAGTYKAKSIKVAEAAKVIENVQRDVNIALVNELHQIFTKIGIKTSDVIDAASTKWNFMKLTPGLVGGHCIGVDPYYLIHKSQSTGYIPDLMKKAREINNSMPDFVVSCFIDELLRNKISPVDLNVLIFGFSFKSDCPDIRNTKVIDVYNILVSKGFNVEIYDNMVDPVEVKKEYGIDIISSLSIEVLSNYSVSFIATEHESMQVIDDDFALCYRFK